MASSMHPRACPSTIIWTITVMTLCGAQDVTVNTTLGLVRGFSDYVQGTKVDKYLGIPYAVPPLGDLRFADPVGKAPWVGTWNATERRPLCAMAGLDAQNNRGGGGDKISEDCLYLNVYVPEDFGAPMEGLPVVVLLTGMPMGLRSPGALPVTEALMLDGSVLAAVQSLIVVTVQFRRDMFGFLTDDETHVGNYALKDQALALKWVVDNIGRFKGNRNRITLGGLMEGGIYVAMHMVAPASKGLFQRAFMTGYVSPFSDAIRKHYPGGGSSATFTKELAEKLNCGNGAGQSIVACLRRVDMQRLIQASVSLYEEKYKNQTDGYWMFMDTVDGNFLSDDVTALWEAGAFVDVPLLVGGEPIPIDSDFRNLPTINETSYQSRIHRLVSPMPWDPPSPANSYLQPLVQATVFSYMNWTNKDARNAQQLMKIEGDRRLAGKVQMLRAYVGNENRDKTQVAPQAYKYIFNYRSSQSTHQGVALGDDVLYMLGEPLRSGRWSLTDQQVSRLMMVFYGNFISYGDPTHSSGISWWPVFDTAEHTYLEVNREGSTDIHQNYRQDKISFWNHHRPKILSQLQDIVLDVKRNPAQFDSYLENPNVEVNEDTTAAGNSANDTKSKETEDNDDDEEEEDYKKYFMATWVLAGVGILLAIGIVILLIITYRVKAKAYTFEGTKL